MEAKVAARARNSKSNPRDLLPNEPAANNKTETPSSVVLVKRIGAFDGGNYAALDRKTVSERTAELLSMLDRKVKFEVLEDAGVVQIQVIDAQDGKVVRKIPADEVIRFLELMKDRMERIDDGVDVRA